MTRRNASSTSAGIRAIDALRRSIGYKFPPLGRTVFNCAFAALPRRIDVQLFPGIHAELDTRDGTQRSTYWLGDRFEHPTPQVLSAWTNHPETTFFDIGSNYGWFSFYLASSRPALAVHAFEPNPKTFALLQGIIERNAMAPRIHAWNCGLGDGESLARLRIGTEDSGHSTFGPHPELQTQSDVEIPIHAFDTWRKNNGLQLPASPSWVAKIDVEGFEVRVINGMREALQARAFRGLAVEALASTLSFCGTSERELIDTLDSFGYVEQPVPASSKRTANRFFVPAAK